jgi:hypothetical protein
MNEEIRIVRESARDLPVFDTCDVVVLGGGPAGIAAAAAAARAGARTLLVERYGFLGGMGTAGGVTNFCGLYANVHGHNVRVVRGVVDDLLERLEKLDGLNAPHMVLGKVLAQAFDVSAFKIAADDLVVASGARILFHAFAAGIVASVPGRIDAVVLETKSGRVAVRADVFVDCSGDADLAAWAGVPFEVGSGPGGMLYPSTMYRMGGVDPVRAGEAWRTIPQLMEAAARDGARFPRKGAIVRPQKHPTEWRANITQLANSDGSAVSGIDALALSNGEIEGRRQVRETFAFLRTVAGFEHAYLTEIAPQIGIRETRRIVGEYVLSETDVLDSVGFDDTIGVNGWPVENHVAGGVEWRWPKIPESRGFNQLPYRMLLPLGVDNLLVAGRCASMTHTGQSAARVMGPCFVMGEAAGTAAALAARGGVTPRALGVDPLQNRLEADGVYLGKKLPEETR